ncbi:hypothetical protein [Streptomyces sp. NPDC059402]|uniref:hypothetical protein n=1 Tax=Streptomyces sp. NPDC059402 TaxID=3346822 RepID=UPI0036CC4D9B
MTAMRKDVSAYTRETVHNFEKYEFLTSESQDPDGMVILKSYRDDGSTPYFTSFGESPPDLSFENVSASVRCDEG